MNKTVTMCIRVSEEELSKVKLAARLEAYGSHSEFVRRTMLIEANRIIANNMKQEQDGGVERQSQ